MKWHTLSEKIPKEHEICVIITEIKDENKYKNIEIKRYEKRYKKHPFNVQNSIVLYWASLGEGIPSKECIDVLTCTCNYCTFPEYAKSNSEERRRMILDKWRRKQ